MRKCKHTTTREVPGSTRCYTGSVAEAGQENRAAHGGIQYTQECEGCGARRYVLVNGSHHECGPWGPSAAEQEALSPADEDRALAESGYVVLSVDRARLFALIAQPGGIRTYWACGDIERAAASGLPVYRALLRRVREWRE